MTEVIWILVAGGCLLIGFAVGKLWGAEEAVEKAFRKYKRESTGVLADFETIKENYQKRYFELKDKGLSHQEVLDVLNGAEERLELRR